MDLVSSFETLRRPATRPADRRQSPLRIGPNCSAWRPSRTAKAGCAMHRRLSSACLDCASVPEKHFMQRAITAMKASAVLGVSGAIVLGVVKETSGRDLIVLNRNFVISEVVCFAVMLLALTVVCARWTWRVVSSYKRGMVWSIRRKKAVKVCSRSLSSTRHCRIAWDQPSHLLSTQHSTYLRNDCPRKASTNLCRPHQQSTCRPRSGEDLS